MFRYLLPLALVAALQAASPCPNSHEVQPSENLPDLAREYLGNPGYAISIALATNARTADKFSYVSNPDDLKGVARVCVPSKSEAKELRKSWENYERAVDAARLPRMSTIAPAQTLAAIPPDQPVNVVAWMRSDQTARLKTTSGEWIKTAASETWVTVEPHLRDFCRTFARDHKPDETKLTQRLEQRLGLSPSSSKTQFVRIRLDRPGSAVIFRPCADSAADHGGCSLGPPADSPEGYRQWFNQQYYSSYGLSLIGEFPWTSLGYTFDWAPSSGKQTPFQRFGESEFVIRKDAPIEILEALTTAQYCDLPAVRQK